MMKRRSGRPALAFALALAMKAAAVAQPSPPAASIPQAAAPAPYSHGRFDEVTLYRPAGAPTQMLLLLSGADGWSAADDRQAQVLARDGALVAGIDLPRLRHELAQDRCVSLQGDFENLAHHLQAYLRLDTYLKPVLAGRGQGAAWAYAVAAQAPAEAIGGLVTWGFCPQLVGRQAPCEGAGRVFRPAGAGSGAAVASAAARGGPPPSRAASPTVALSGPTLLPVARLAMPWFHLETAAATCPAQLASAFVARVGQARTLPLAGGDDPRPAQVLAELARLNPPVLPPPPASLADLPLIEVPAAAAAPASGRLAILLSGDGGWAEIDKAIADALAQAGVAVVGLDSLRYFWSQRTPQILADDLDRIARHYARQWQREQLILVGYSQGADVLPFAINRLPAATRSRLHYTALLGLARMASFEFHLSNWLGPSGDQPVAPEAQRLDARATLCIYGSREEDSLCPALPAGSVTAVRLPGDHHFNGDFEGVTRLILQHAGAR